jgi:hypothetical protein
MSHERINFQAAIIALAITCSAPCCTRTTSRVTTNARACPIKWRSNQRSLRPLPPRPAA